MNEFILEYLHQLEYAAKQYHIPGKQALRIHKSDQRIWFGELFEDEEGRCHEKYISARDTDRIRALLLGKYSRAILLEMRSFRQGKSSLEKVFKLTDDYSVQFPEYIPSELLSLQERGRRWALSEYIRSPMEISTGTGYQSRKGDWVRSRAELWIADYLFQKKIPYHYEEALTLKNGGTVFPDFTILDVYTGKKFYLEYFGLMHNPEYVTKNLKRINELAQSGVILGKNMLAAFECRDVPFNPAAVRLMIDSILQVPGK